MLHSGSKTPLHALELRLPLSLQSLKQDSDALQCPSYQVDYVLSCQYTAFSYINWERCDSLPENFMRSKPSHIEIDIILWLAEDSPIR